MRARAAIPLLLTAGAAVLTVGAADIPVDGNPIATIADAIAQATDGDRILVDPGTYAECIDTLGLNLEIVSTEWLSSGTNTSTILDGEGAVGCGASAPVVYLDAGSTLTGFTVRGGLNTGIVALEAAVITNNLITDNEGIDGGGLYAGDTATILDNRITQNLATRHGGGMYLYASDYFDGFEAETVVQGNRIDDNEALLDGGGAYVYAVALTGAGPPVRLDDNVVATNTADGFGGGLVVKTFAEPGATTSIRVTRNTVDGNTITGVAGMGYYLGYGGGVWATTYGLGSETIAIDENTVTSNATTTSGGGVSAWVQTIDTGVAPDHEVRVEANEIASNTSAGDGGGLDLYVEARSLTPGAASMRLRSERNVIRANRAEGSFGVGGGMFTLVRAERSGAAGEIDVSLQLDEITANQATISGGGAALLAQAFADPDPLTAPLPAFANVRMRNALVAGNTVADPGQSSGSGGGILAYVDLDGSNDSTFGTLPDDGEATIELDLLTVANNTCDIGGAVEIESIRTSTSSGRVEVSVHNAIVAQNDAYGIGGPAPGAIGNVTSDQSTELRVEVTYTDRFSNTSGDIESSIVPDDQTGTIFADPLLDAMYVPGRCSPTIDGGDPTDDGSAEPPYNKNDWINMGRYGGTALAERSLPDVTGDDVVDGFDLIQITTRFGSTALDPPGSPYLAEIDLDRNGIIDGIELALVAADFGVECAP